MTDYGYATTHEQMERLAEEAFAHVLPGTEYQSVDTETTGGDASTLQAQVSVADGRTLTVDCYGRWWLGDSGRGVYTPDWPTRETFARWVAASELDIVSALTAAGFEYASGKWRDQSYYIDAQHSEDDEWLTVRISDHTGHGTADISLVWEWQDERNAPPVVDTGEIVRCLLEDDVYTTRR